MELIERRRALIAAQPRLPWEYQEVEYLRSTGTQKLNIPYRGNQNSVFTVKAKVDAGASYQTIVGNIVSYTIIYGYMVIIEANRSVSFRSYSNSITKLSSVNISPNIPYLYKLEKGKLTINGVEYQGNTDLTDTLSNTTSLLYRNYYNAASEGRMSGDIYSFLIEEIGNRIHELVPCYRKSNNKPGMYDLVSKAFLTNAGAGEFTVGPNVN